jgi:hypothetical protein
MFGSLAISAKLSNKPPEEITLCIYLFHVQLKDTAQVTAWFVVVEEGSLQGPLVHEVQCVPRMS